MSGLFSTLSSTASALNAQTQAISVASNNIANLNNANYARETVSFSSLGEVQTANGIESTGTTVTVSQARSAVLDQMVRQESSLTAGFTAEQTVYQQAQAALGESITSSSTDSSSTTSDSGLQAAISSFFNGVQNFASDPTDPSQREALIQQAGTLTDRFQAIDQNLAQVQSAAGAQVTSSVTSANTLLTDVANLNSQIGSAEATSPGSAVALRDQREDDLEQLAGLIPITVTEGANGEDLVTTPGPSSAVALVTDGTVTNSLAYAGGALTAGTSALSPSSGTIQGTITASVGAVQTLRDNLNALASQLVTSVNAAYNPSDAAGGNFFDASGTTAGTMAVDSNLTSTSLTGGPGGAGDNTLALAIAAVANQTFSTGSGDAIDGTVTSFYANAVSSIGQALDTANTRVTDQTSVQSIVNTQRDSVSGVSLNDEMTNLMSYQRAFQASSEVFQIVNTLLEQVVTQLGVAGT
jgi:flagellar hook-associated protein 1 FlgK